MADEKDKECDPLKEDCDLVRESVLEKTEESAKLQSGIDSIETSLKALDTASNLFEDESGGDAFKEEKERLNDKLEEAKKMKKEFDDQCYNGVKKFNICKKNAPEKK